MARKNHLQIKEDMVNKTLTFSIRNTLLAVLALITVLAFSVSSVGASNTPNFTQTINAGTLATDILDNTRASVASPAYAFGAKTFSFDCFSGGTASTATLGSNTQRIYVMNPDNADNGWTLTMAATGGTTTVWDAGAATDYDFNDAGGSGCTDGGDTDTFGGQLTVDANAGTLTADCGSCTTANVTKGSSTAYSEGVTDSVTLLSAAAGSDDIWRGYLTGATMSQTIPAEQVPGSYTLNMTLTATAL